MEIFKAIIEFIRDNSVGKIPKLFIFLMILILFLFIDNISGFSYYYNLNNKLTQLEKASNLLNNQNLDSITRKELLKTRTEIILRKTIKDNIYENWSKISFTDSNDQILNEINSSSKIRNSIIEFISLNYFLIILFVFMPFYAIIQPFSNSLLKNTFVLIIAEIFIIILGFLLFFTFSLIPTLFNRPYLNYILNFSFITICLIINTYRISKKTVEISR